MIKIRHPLLLLFMIVFGLQNYQSMAQRSITFSGYEWWVKNGSGGPGPNLWSDNDSSVWIDKSGYLHLKIKKTGNNWYCSEVNLNSSLGYGTYNFVVESDLAKFDKNIVVGLFLYEDDTKEIDIEFARWGNALTVPGWYTIQPPPYTAANQHSFDIDTGVQLSTHSFDWLPDKTYFRSIKGVEEVVPPNNNLLAEWTYTGIPQPSAGNERLHINFWLFQGLQPSNKKDAELVIRKVEFKPANGIKEELENGFDIFPNPAQDKISFQVPENSSFRAEIINEQGVILQTFNICSSNAVHDISFLPEGLYFLRINDGNMFFSKKLIVQKH